MAHFALTITHTLTYFRRESKCTCIAAL